MKVILIQPPFTIFRNEGKKCHPPLGLAYLAAAIMDGHDVVVLDSLAEGYANEEAVSGSLLRYGLSFEDIKKKVGALKPDVVAVSCLFSAQSENVHTICKTVKEIDKGIITIVGGAHPSAVPEEVLKDINVDFVVIGEGEIVLKRLLESIENKKDFREVEGIGFRYAGSVIVNQRKEYLQNLDDLPFPYWDIFPIHRYSAINNPHGSPAKRVPFAPMITSRGCPFECIFCSIHNLWGRNYRMRSSENVLAEIGYLNSKFGVKEILFEDDNLTLDGERANRIFQGIIDRKLDILWSVPNGVAAQTLDNEILELMKRSGCYSISLGIESGDEYILKNIVKKPIALSGIKTVIRKAKKLGLETTAFFVVGLPGETGAHLKSTFSFARSLACDNTNFFFATPLPGTRLLQLCKEKGLVNGRLDYSRLKSDYPSFANESFSIPELYALVNREKLITYMRILLTDPFRFIGKVFAAIKKNPRFFAKLKTLAETKYGNE